MVHNVLMCEMFVWKLYFETGRCTLVIAKLTAAYFGYVTCRSQSGGCYVWWVGSENVPKVEDPLRANMTRAWQP